MNINNTAQLTDEQIVKSIHSYQNKIKFLGIISIILYISVFGGFSAAGLFLVFSNGPLAIVSVIIGVVCIPISFLLDKKIKKLKKEMKKFVGENVTKQIIAERIEIEEYDATGGFKDKFIRGSGIVPAFDKSYTSDYIKGYYKGNRVVYCDLKLEYEKTERDSDGRKRKSTVTVFHGHLFSLNLGKELEGYVKICERRNPRKKKGFVTELLTNALYSAGVTLGPEEIEVESVEFNNQFEIKTNNKELAFYILTPHFMENIIKADELAQGYTNIKFDGDRAKISINNGHDSFELSKTIFNQKRLEESRQNMRNDLNVMLSIIDEILEKDRLFEK